MRNENKRHPRVGRQILKQFRECFQPAGGCTDSYDRKRSTFAFLGRSDGLVTGAGDPPAPAFRASSLVVRLAFFLVFSVRFDFRDCFRRAMFLSARGLRSKYHNRSAIA